MPSSLFSPLRLRDVTLRNRIVVSPMCEYSSQDGFANDWHVVHLGSRAVGGAGAVLTEAAAVTADGRISSVDLGIYSDDHVEPLARIFRFVEAQGAVPGMQLAHAGRKASTARPFHGGGPVSPADGGWEPIWAPSPMAFRDGWQVPRAMTVAEIRKVVARVCRGRAAGARGRREDRRAPRGARLPAARVPLAAQQPSRRRVRRVVREPDPLRARSRGCRAGRVAGAPSAVGCASRRRIGPRAAGRSRTRSRWRAQLGDRGVDLVDCSSGGNVAAREDPARSGLSGAVRRARPARDGDHDRRRGPDHRAGAGARRSCARAAPTSSSSRARCCAIRTGRCTPRWRSATRRPCPCSTSVPSRKLPASSLSSSSPSARARLQHSAAQLSSSASFRLRELGCILATDGRVARSWTMTRHGGRGECSDDPSDRISFRTTQTSRSARVRRDACRPR